MPAAGVDQQRVPETPPACNQRGRDLPVSLYLDGMGSKPVSDRSLGTTDDIKIMSTASALIESALKRYACQLLDGFRELALTGCALTL
jgi:hypothetical protein